MFNARFDADLAGLLLIVIGVVCLVGLMNERFRENWLQAVGLGGVVLVTIPRGWELIQKEIACMAKSLPLDVCDTVRAHHFWLYLALVVYFVGTAWKVWRHRNDKSNPNGTGKAHP